MSTISVILGSVRPGSQGIRLGLYLEKTLLKKNVPYHIIDPMKLSLPVMFGRYDWIKDSPICPKGLHNVSKQLVDSDAFVIVAPEYNHSIPPALSNTLNYFYHNEFYKKPAGIVTYSMGSFGGARTAVALRPFLGELGLVTIPKMLPIPNISKTIDEKGNPNESSIHLEPGMQAFIDELLWFSKCLKDGRSTK